MSRVDLTTRQVAERLKAAGRTVRQWCKRGLFPHPYDQQTPRGSFWLIPESDLKDFKPPKMGRPRKSPEGEGSKKASKKKGGKK